MTIEVLDEAQENLIAYGSHRALARRFPSAIYYRQEPGIIRVRAVIDCRRHPRWIQHRLRSGSSEA